MTTRATRNNRIIALVLTALLAATLVFNLDMIPSYAASSVVVGHAASGENGLKNQEAGDQTGNEVYTMAWNYSSTTNAARNWVVVARCQTTAKAKRIAQVVKDACDNDNVGYDQNNYKSFYTALKNTGDPSKPSTWDASKITDKVETTCTPLIAAAVQAAGIDLGDKVGYESKALVKELAKTGEFTFYFAEEDSLYTEVLELISNNGGKALVNPEMVTTDRHLVPGDILLSMHPHGATVISSPNSSNLNAVEKETETATNKSDLGYKVGKDYKTTTDRTIRYGPGTTYAVKPLEELTTDGQAHAHQGPDGAVLNKGTEVTVLEVSGVWVRIPSGWICAGVKSSGTKYLKAVSTGSSSSSKKTTTTDKQSTTDKKTTTTKVTVKVGKDYKLKKVLYVRTGPGTEYAAKKRSQLSDSAKQYAVKGIKEAKFKKGTVVTCLEKKGDWMRVPSGWICCKPGNVANA